MARRKPRLLKLLFWLVLLPVGLVVIAFAVANRDSVTVRFDPLPFAIDLPLYAVGLAGIFIGLLAGGVMTWLRGGRWRRLARQQQRENERLERELAPLRPRNAAPGLPAPASSGSDITRAA